jgi:hypothetical protein
MKTVPTMTFVGLTGANLVLARNYWAKMFKKGCFPQDIRTLTTCFKNPDVVDRLMRAARQAVHIERERPRNIQSLMDYLNAFAAMHHVDQGVVNAALAKLEYNFEHELSLQLKTGLCGVAMPALLVRQLMIRERSRTTPGLANLAWMMEKFTPPEGLGEWILFKQLPIVRPQDVLLCLAGRDAVISPIYLKPARLIECQEPMLVVHLRHADKMQAFLKRNPYHIITEEEAEGWCEKRISGTRAGPEVFHSLVMEVVLDMRHTRLKAVAVLRTGYEQQFAAFTPGALQLLGAEVWKVKSAPKLGLIGKFLPVKAEHFTAREEAPDIEIKTSARDDDGDEEVPMIEAKCGVASFTGMDLSLDGGVHC